MNYKIISDSSSDLLQLQDCAFESVPLKIITREKEYVDDATLIVDGMIEDLLKYKGESKSSCPNAEDWKSAFGDNEGVFCVTITSGLSGSYNTANLALNEYLSKNPEKQGCVIDTLSAGPEVTMIVEKLKELISANLDFQTIKEKITEYKNKTHLIFSLDSLRNLANNGRISFAAAKVAGLLGIRVIGKASNEGTLEITDKSRGSVKAIADIVKNMLKNGYEGGKVRIHHCRNLDMANELMEKIKEKFPMAAVILQETRGLCSFYAESGGLLVGFEGMNK